MNEIKENSKVLIISWSPVPTPKFQKIEGSGQRFFGLANGLKANGVDDITIAVGYIYPLDISEVNGIKLINYKFDDKFISEMKKYDTIIFNYAIHGSDFITKNLPDTAQVIIDAYGPAYIENLARDPSDMKNTYIGNKAVVDNTFNKVLKRGDFFLYANEAQEKLYTGVLATLGIINQFTYKMDRLLWTPFGIENPSNKKLPNPYKKYGVKDDDFVLLWFGGLYPWFDIREVLRAVKDISKTNKKLKFFLVGGNNPQNQHPDFVKNYFDTVNYVDEIGMKDQITFIDWADYATRRGYYEHANAIISINNNGKENVYSWRTRVMDYLGSTTPLITNGGDPLSDEMVATGAGFIIDHLSEKGIRESIENVLKNPELITEASKKMKDLQPKYYWSATTKLLSEKIKNLEMPWSEEREFRAENQIMDGVIIPAAGSRFDIRRQAARVRNISRKIREKGFATSAKIIGDKVERKAKRIIQKSTFIKENPEPRLVVISNQFDNTGAPAVIIDLLSELKNEYPELSKKVVLKTFTPVSAENLAKMRKVGVKTEVYTNRELSLNLNKGDVVFFNSFAISRTTSISALNALKEGIIEKLFWYGHEDSPDGFFDKDIKKRVAELLGNGKIEMFAVSKGTLKKYQEYFGIKTGIKKMTFRFLLDEKFFSEKDKDDFKKLKFTSVGSLMDMRKGQYPILYAFLDFYNNFYLKYPKKYRDFEIDFLGAYNLADETDAAPYHIRNILEQFRKSATGLGDHVKILPVMNHGDALDEIKKKNVTICYSLKEAMGIFVYEGMAMGHVIIRNETPGLEEQLDKNGLFASSNNFGDLVLAIEKLANTEKTSDAELLEMSSKSVEIAKEATENKYFVIEEITELL